ncbi:PTS mannose transporter subunit IIABC [Trueperella pyogenes TP8]|uniref:glucose PTS transporter subunit IIA n=1 Tax=Trueperella pyogenes TaxID=1661 RepID=UPI0005803DF9|nr:glucose PTS transporter subunit IIA [Trueperella pyogenes]AJC68991.1 PTS mannose transporter subunit IIABC [Trueperella pyogenes TP8]
MTSTSARSIIDNVGGAGNIRSLTHCATRLRFELHDASKVNTAALDAIPGVLGVVPQSGDRLQVICGGGVETMFTAINALPDMKGIGTLTDAEVKAQARAKARGRFSWLDNFFEYLSDSFRPILGVLLGASLIIATTAVLDALEIVNFRAADKPAAWVFVDAMWRSVFYFLPIMVAYNAAKKLRVDPWLGATIMAALMTPEFMKLSKPELFADTFCTTNETLGTTSCATTIFGLSLQLNEYGGQVFVPLIMVAVLAVIYHGLKKIFPESIQMVFVPFFSMLIMIPVTAFLIGPLGVWMGTGIGAGLSWMNTNAPFVFAIIIPMLYPFLVPLGLHWPLNALMLINIQTLGYDFIQGPMGTWNFACFGATAGVLFISLRERDVQMRQTASGALAAGLFGGISEPSLYGIHLRFKRIYPRMLLGCFAGGLTIAILSAPFAGVQTHAFAFTSLLTISVFKPMWVYAISIAVAFFTAMFAIILTDYRTPEERAAAKAARQNESDEAVSAPDAGLPSEPALGSVETNAVFAPVAGEAVTLADAGDQVFSSGALGVGVAIKPAQSQIVAPVSGTVRTVAKTGHAFGLKTDDGVEILVHVGIDTVKLDGAGFAVAVAKGQRVDVGDLLVEVDIDAVAAAGYAPTVLMTVTNSKALGQVMPVSGKSVVVGEPVITISSGVAV